MSTCRVDQLDDWFETHLDDPVARAIAVGSARRCQAAWRLVDDHAWVFSVHDLEMHRPPLPLTAQFPPASTERMHWQRSQERRAHWLTHCTRFDYPADPMGAATTKALCTSRAQLRTAEFDRWLAYQQWDAMHSHDRELSNVWKRTLALSATH